MRPRGATGTATAAPAAAVQRVGGGELERASRASAKGLAAGSLARCWAGYVGSGWR